MEARGPFISISVCSPASSFCSSTLERKETPLFLTLVSRFPSKSPHMARPRVHADLWTSRRGYQAGFWRMCAASYGNHGDPTASGGRDVHGGNRELSQGEGVTVTVAAWPVPTPRTSALASRPLIHALSGKAAFGTHVSAALLLSLGD